MTHDAERWRQAKKRRKGIMMSIEFYIPIPKEWIYNADEGKRRIVAKLNPILERFEKEIRSLNGIMRTYNDP